MTTQPTIRFAAIGLNHFHIYGQTNLLLKAGAELVAFYAEEPDLAALYQKDYPQAKQVTDKRAILEDESIQLVISAAIPSERAPLGIEVMRHGKDYMSDKPGFTTLDQLAAVRQVQQETGRIYSIDYSERLETRASPCSIHSSANVIISPPICTLCCCTASTNFSTMTRSCVATM